MAGFQLTRYGRIWVTPEDKGERIRIAIAGADDGNLDRLPSTGDPVLTVERNSAAPSWIELPIVAAVK
jgi:hypothetical protein